ncbi:MAG: prepilin-type N-terminal cleavage/methylation domain-containing protein [Phycisphaeraceae bacterium]|nr:MAG: prepilin-type N-terminal cleavage/methylation domain-containing protein [Phycisphaeraceae bacterium]
MLGSKAPRAFTLIELLVVIAIIALLIGILLPSLGSARREARAVKAAATLRNVNQGAASYTVESRKYPLAYTYASDDRGNWNFNDQRLGENGGTYGYIHWSWALFNSGNTPEAAFRSPAVQRGGAPATNPGPDPDNWEPGQENDNGNPAPAATPEDKQVKRVAFASNAAIIPRNKLVANNDNERKNRFVDPADISQTAGGDSRVIFATELRDGNDWRTVFSSREPTKSKSHRSISPFIGFTSGTDVYNQGNAPGGRSPFGYPDPDTRIWSLDDNRSGEFAIDNNQTDLNVVGRSHPGGDKKYGGTANFVFCDGHGERMTVRESIQKRLWGDRFYGLTGGNRVDMTNYVR